MHTLPAYPNAASNWQRQLRLVLGCLFLLGIHSAQANGNLDIDLHTWSPGQEPIPGHNPPDGLNDVWQTLYNAWGLNPSGDEDGDGCSNLMESVAGSNPFLAGDCFKVGDMLITSNQLVFYFNAKAGKQYRVLCDDSPTGSFTTAAPLAAPQSGHTFVPTVDTNNQILRVAKSPDSRKFYRLETADVDSNGDGVSDWVARKLGYDPHAPSIDLDGNGISDLKEALEAELSSPDEVTVVAGNAFASEDGPESGSFVVKRNRTLFDASVNLNFSGTASPTTDYSKSPSVSTVVFAPGEKEKTIHINPSPSQPAAVEGAESVTLSLSSPASTVEGATPVVGTPSTATVIIRDSTVPSGTGLYARYFDTANSVLMHGGNFGQAGTYAYVRTSTATPNTGTITIPYTGPATVEVGHTVRATFTGGNLNNALYNHQDYTVSAVSPGVNFTLAISGSALPTNSNSNCQFSFQSVAHPGTLERVDPVVDHPWLSGTPNGVPLTVGSVQTNQPDNYSTYWEGYLAPTAAGNYQFQLDADDKARVLLDLNRNGTFEPEEQIIEHGWDSAATVGTFKQSAAHSLVIPANAAERYLIRVEHVETTGEARCRLQWRAGTATFANIPQANVFTHTQAMSANYSFTRTVTTAGAMQGTISVTLNGHGLAINDTVQLAFSSGVLFTPANGNFHGEFTVSSVTSANVFVVPISAASLPASASSSGAGFVLNRPASPTTGWFNMIYANTTFSAPPGRVGVDGAGATNSNNGIWGVGTPDVNLINPDTFSVRWTGQVQPQFTEEYTFSVLADDGFRLWINGQEMSMRQLASVNLGSSTYSYTSATGETVINYAGSNIVAGSFGVGDHVRVDPTNGTLGTAATSGAPNQFNYGTTDLVVTAATATTFTVFFPTGHGNQAAGATINIDAMNRPIKPWVSNTNERYARMSLVGGVRYDIQLDYYENTGSARCQLFWFSPSQPKQIIPSNRLYPNNAPVAPPAHLTETEATALVGGPFSHPVIGSNGAAVSFTGLPAWLSFNDGVLSGTPPPDAADRYQIVITFTSPVGISKSVIDLRVINTGGAITREVWTGLAGTSISTLPTSTAPTATSTLPTLEAPTDFADNYGTRLRGFITAPETGNYYFWVAGSDAAELWISNDEEPVNAFRRAWQTSGSSTPQSWNVASSQRSAWLALEQGKRYYVEVLHKAGVGAGDNLAVGWSKPGQPSSNPTEIVPSYALSPWSAPVAPTDGGTVYAATLRPQGGAITNASGSSFLRVNAAETEAIITIKYSGLTSDFFGMHVHDDMIPGGGFNNIIADLEEPGDVQLLPDGTYKWVIKPTAGYSVADLVDHLKNGQVYFNVHSINFTAGEIKGYYARLDGSPTFTPPPAPPTWSSDHNTDAGAVRFLTQATYGASIDDVAALKAMPSYEAWIEDQFTKPTSPTLPEVLRTRRADAQGGTAFDETLFFNSWWRHSVSGPDQLRQRIAFALSEILVVSAQGPLDNRGEAIAFFYDNLLNDAFGNFRDIMEDVTLTPTMGRYLDMLRNDKPDLAIGRIPNENYAREIKQLFSVGLFRMWPDGTLILNSRFEPIDIYSQREIVGYSHVFTGWDYGYDGTYRTTIGAPANWMRQMREVPARHFTGSKRILNNEVLPGLEKIGTQPLDPYATHNSMHFNDPAFQALPQQELDATHDQLFYHPNTGPFICRQLIQRLVTSHPSRDYVYRVVQAFNNNGAGVRGDMRAVIKAILLDYEARSPAMISQPHYGKQREPVLRLTAAGRAFRPGTFSGSYAQNGTRTITITTTQPHNLASGNNVFLEFEAGDAEPAPWTGTYAATTPLTATTFTVTARGWANGTYSIPANSTVCTVSMSNHWLESGNQVFMDFTSGAANGTAIDGQVYTISHSSTTSFGNNGNSFTINVPANASSRSGNCMIPRFSPGSYAITASGLPAPQDRRVTMRTNEDHHLKVGDQVQVNIYGAATLPWPVDVVATVESVVDLKTWTYLVSGSLTGYGTNRSYNSVYQFPLLSQPLTRSGTINSRSSTYQMGNTDANLEQSPLNADTVFNFFLPDFKFAGPLAAQGLTTPEFQLTAETSTVRQANFIFNGIFNPNTTNGYSSFSTGNNALVLDTSRWMAGNATNLGLGAPANTSTPWTHNQNIARLIDHLSTLLTANQMTPEAKTIIRDLVSLRIASINTGNPCTINTIKPHGYKTGDTINVSGVSNGTFSPTLNDTTTAYTITRIDDDSFTLTGVNCTAAPNSTGLANAHASPIVYSNGSTNPSTTTRRDRIRSILHLILTSPDFTIQR